MKRKTIFFTMTRTAWFALFLSFMIITPIPVNFVESQYKVLHETYPRLTMDIFELVVVKCYYKHVPYVHIFALIKHESNFTITAIHHNKNGTTDYGLMQINSSNYHGDCNDLFNPVLNTEIGISMYRECYKKAKGDWRTAFRFYNAGMNSREERYNNWEYVYGIISYIKMTTQRIKEFYQNCF